MLREENQLTKRRFGTKGLELHEQNKFYGYYQQKIDQRDQELERKLRQMQAEKQALDIQE